MVRERQGVLLDLGPFPDPAPRAGSRTSLARRRSDQREVVSPRRRCPLVGHSARRKSSREACRSPDTPSPNFEGRPRAGGEASPRARVGRSDREARRAFDYARSRLVLAGGFAGSRRVPTATDRLRSASVERQPSRRVRVTTPLSVVGGSASTLPAFAGRPSSRRVLRLNRRDCRRVPQRWRCAPFLPQRLDHLLQRVLRVPERQHRVRREEQFVLDAGEAGPHRAFEHDA